MATWTPSAPRPRPSRAQEYRRQRIAAMKEAAARPRFGTLELIKANEWEQKITRAGDDVWVVVHLFKEYVSQCSVLNECLDELARRYPNSRFVKIISTEAIPKYPDVALPTLLLYHNGKKEKDLVGMEVFGGRNVTPEEVALALNEVGDICKADGDVDRDAASKREAKALLEKLVIQAAEGSEGESSDFDD